MHTRHALTAFPAAFPLADGNGCSVLSELPHDFLLKAAIVGVLAVVVVRQSFGRE